MNVFDKKKKKNGKDRKCSSVAISNSVTVFVEVFHDQRKTVICKR